MASTLIKRVPILDDPPEKRRVAVTERLPNLSNYLATDVSAWAAEMIIVRDNGLWQEAGAASWEDYCTNVVRKPLDWCSWIIGGYEALRAGRENRPVREDEALEAGKKAAAVSVSVSASGKLGTNQYTKGVKLLNSSKNGPTSEYLASRIKRDRPEIAAAVERGEFRSIAAAARAAGIDVPPTVKLGTPQKVAASILRHRGSDYVRELMDALKAHLREDKQ